jgi:hypothetical protein
MLGLITKVEMKKALKEHEHEQTVEAESSTRWLEYLVRGMY